MWLIISDAQGRHRIFKNTYWNPPHNRKKRHEMPNCTFFFSNHQIHPHNHNPPVSGQGILSMKITPLAHLLPS
jgi:hypothetical protein